MEKPKNNNEIYKDIIIASDFHLGTEDGDKKEVIRFLDYVGSEKNLDLLVLNGDILDFWRRDDAKVMFENVDVLNKLTKLTEKSRVRYIVGNHESNLRSLEGKHQFGFPSQLIVRSNGVKYRILHGHQFDRKQSELFSDILCRISDDSLGDKLDKIWDKVFEPYSIRRITPDPSYYKDMKDIIEQVVGVPQEAKVFSERVEKSREAIKSRAIEYAKKLCKEDPSQYLIFAHTHRPFVDDNAKVANSGAWTGEAPVSGTYLRIKGSNVKLEKF